MGLNEDQYFYWATTKKIAAIFGALFNDIKVARKTSDGALSNVTEVPLSYGPRAKFLTRIRESNEDKISIQLPRMSYEISGYEYDTSRKVSPIYRRKLAENSSAYVATPYILSFELSIFSRTLDDNLQIMEQIIPAFKPEYTVSVKDLEGPGTTTDVQFLLESISMSDDYEGDYGPVRAIVQTLTFSANVKYLGPVSDAKIIKRVEAAVRNFENGAFWEKIVEKADEPTSFISFIDPTTEYLIVVNDTTGYQVGENVIGETSGYGALCTQVFDSTTLVVKNLENTLILGENLIGETTNASSEIVDVSEK